MSRTTRKAYTGSKRFSKGCRSGGNCPYCVAGRKHKHTRRESEASDASSDAYYDALISTGFTEK